MKRIGKTNKLFHALGTGTSIAIRPDPLQFFFFNLVFNRGGGHLNLLNKTIHRTGTMLEPEVRGA